MPQNNQDSLLWLLRDKGKVSQAECTSSGIAYIASTEAYGKWEFDIYKAPNSTTYVYFIASTNTGGESYRLFLSASEAIFFQRRSSNLTLLNTANSYVDAAVFQRYKIVREADGAFTVSVRGEGFGNSYVVADTTGGSGTNPVTDNTHTASGFIVIDFDTGDKIRDFVAPSGQVDLTALTVSSGAYTLSEVRK